MQTYESSPPIPEPRTESIDGGIDRKDVPAIYWLIVDKGGEEAIEKRKEKCEVDLRRLEVREALFNDPRELVRERLQLLYQIALCKELQERRILNTFDFLDSLSVGDEYKFDASAYAMACYKLSLVCSTKMRPSMPSIRANEEETQPQGKNN